MTANAKPGRNIVLLLDKSGSPVAACDTNDVDIFRAICEIIERAEYPRPCKLDWVDRLLDNDLRLATRLIVAKEA